MKAKCIYESQWNDEDIIIFYCCFVPQVMRTASWCWCTSNLLYIPTIVVRLFIFFSYIWFYMRQQIYLCMQCYAMKNIYYRTRISSLSCIFHMKNMKKDKKILNLYVKCQKFSPAFYHFYDLSYIQICPSFITLLFSALLFSCRAYLAWCY